MTNNQTNLHDYLIRELARYYPDSFITVDIDGDNESIRVTFDFTDSGDYSMVFTMRVGSDDDYFDFVDDRGNHITVPLNTADLNFWDTNDD